MADPYALPVRQPREKKANKKNATSGAGSARSNPNATASYRLDGAPPTRVPDNERGRATALPNRNGRTTANNNNSRERGRGRDRANGEVDAPKKLKQAEAVSAFATPRDDEDALLAGESYRLDDLSARNRNPPRGTYNLDLRSPRVDGTYPGASAGAPGVVDASAASTVKMKEELGRGHVADENNMTSEAYLPSEARNSANAGVPLLEDETSTAQTSSLRTPENNKAPPFASNKQTAEAPSSSSKVSKAAPPQRPPTRTSGAAAPLQSVPELSQSTYSTPRVENPDETLLSANRDPHKKNSSTLVATLHLIPANASSAHEQTTFPDEIRLPDTLNIQDGAAVEVADTMVFTAKVFPVSSTAAGKKSRKSRAGGGQGGGELLPPTPKVYFSFEAARNLLATVSFRNGRMQHVLGTSAAGEEGQIAATFGTIEGVRSSLTELGVCGIRKLPGGSPIDVLSAGAAGPSKINAPAPPHPPQELLPKVISRMTVEVEDRKKFPKHAPLELWLSHILDGGYFSDNERRFVSVFGKRCGIWIRKCEISSSTSAASSSTKSYALFDRTGRFLPTNYTTATAGASSTGGNKNRKSAASSGGSTRVSPIPTISKITLIDSHDKSAFITFPTVPAPSDDPQARGPTHATSNSSSSTPDATAANTAATAPGHHHQKPTTAGFAQVGGLRPIIDQLTTLIKNPLQNPQVYAQYGLQTPKGVLLYGPPGTGKTLLAKALSEELNCHCEMVEASDLASQYSGETEKKIVDIFDRCQELANEEIEEITTSSSPASTYGGAAGATNRLPQEPAELRRRRKRGCLIFIDEIDALCPKREDSVGESERRIVATFLTLLDGIGAKKGKNDPATAFSGNRTIAAQQGGLVLLAATNRPNALDPALRRPGRLDRELEVGAPNSEARFEILKIMTRKMNMLEKENQNNTAKQQNPHVLISPDGRGGQDQELLSEQDLRQIADDAHGFVGADLQGLCNAVALMRIQEENERTAAGRATREQSSSKIKSLLDLFNFALQNKVKPSALKELQIEIPKVKWHMIGGYADLKQKLQQSVEWPFLHKDLFAKLDLTPPKGILLYGPPGCSKTMMAKAVATESKMNFISIKGPELFNKYVGESERQVRDIFRKARQAQPCVIFFDEIDSMAGSRGNGGGGSGNDVNARVLSQLLNEMDGVGLKQELIIMAATNRPEALDSAIMRPGRFDRLLYVSLPDLAARKDILRNCLLKVKHLEVGILESEGDAGSAENMEGGATSRVDAFAGPASAGAPAPAPAASTSPTSFVSKSSTSSESESEETSESETESSSEDGAARGSETEEPKPRPQVVKEEDEEPPIAKLKKLELATDAANNSHKASKTLLFKPKRRTRKFKTAREVGERDGNKRHANTNTSKTQRKRAVDFVKKDLDTTNGPVRKRKDFYLCLLEELSDKTEGFSGAEIVNLVKEASLRAVREAISGYQQRMRAATTSNKSPNGSTALAAKGPELKKIHLREALAEAKPRTSMEAVRFYEQFELRNR
ncbi:unnamed protein product [Amoebophrya sp. A120]|nr:unnamed protein product [Amoebophrya sp. A120]|eukprot:GSA120T00010726001.1